MAEILDTAILAAKEAGDFLLDNFRKANKVESKGDRNLVTNLDKQAESMIRAKIDAKFPKHGIIGEEGGKKNIDSDYLWIIDPLDGTHNYIRKINIFGVSIGIVHKNKFVGGVVYMPCDDELYWAESGSGAYKNDKKIFVSPCGQLKDTSIAFDSSIRYSPKIMLDVLGDLSKEVFNIRMFGSSVRTLTYVAEGVLDCSVEFHDRPWDFSGSVAIIEEAGGKLTDLRKAPLTYKTIGYVASNKSIHSQISEIVSRYF
ncbi:MAG: inositol monophosphatase [Candidatus Omnitrophica bacterium]|nr:inositol monophosphatase [Candidatus Omnitrophota bacterium]